MKLVSTANTPEEATEQSPAVDASGGGPKYPYGLEISLNDDLITQLGLTVTLGGEVTIQAKGVIVQGTKRPSQDGEDEVYCCIQITDIGVEGVTKAAPKKSMGEVASSLYKE